jgi:hypothetical protein
VFHGEDFGGGAFVEILDVADYLVEVDQVQVLLEVPVGKLRGLAFALQFQHVSDVVQVSQIGYLCEFGVGLDRGSHVLDQIELPSAHRVHCLGLGLEVIEGGLEAVEEFPFAVDVGLSEIDESPAVALECVAMCLFFVDEFDDFCEDIVLLLSQQCPVEVFIDLCH